MLADLIARGTLEDLAGTAAFRRGSPVSAIMILVRIETFAPFCGADSAGYLSMN